MLTTDIILFGKPGSGKGTLAKQLLSMHANTMHLSTGEVFRKHMQNKTPLGLEITELMNSGELIDDELTIAVVEDFVLQHAQKTIIFDGFPRTEKQALWLIQLFIEYDRPIPAFVHLMIDDALVAERLASRAIIENRPEDSSAKRIQSRLNAYYKNTSIVIDVFNEIDAMFDTTDNQFNNTYEIDGSQTTSQVLDEFNTLFA